MNTKISYMYRDASNYKAHREIVVEGELSLSEIEGVLEDGENFIPYQVGVEELQEELTSFPSEDDHVWHELVAVEATSNEPTEVISAEELKRNFILAGEKGWDVSGAMERLGISI